jgi:cytochrome c5
VNKRFSIKGMVVTALLACGLLNLSGVVVAADSGDMSEAAILERIKPVGKLNTSGAPVTAEAPKAEAPAAAAPAPAVEEAAPAATAEEAAPAAAPAATAARSGEEIYKSTCFACHMAGVAGAPKLGDKALWAPRIATGMDAMMTTVLNGKGAMPPRGTCANCSDDDLKAAVEYMVSQGQ